MPMIHNPRPKLRVYNVARERNGKRQRIHTHEINAYGKAKALATAFTTFATLASEPDEIDDEAARLKAKWGLRK